MSDCKEILISVQKAFSHGHSISKMPLPFDVSIRVYVVSIADISFTKTQQNDDYTIYLRLIDLSVQLLGEVRHCWPG